MRYPTEKELSDLRHDKFGHRELATQLVRNVFLEMELPNTFGIYGNWGTGKSTFLKAVQAAIANDEDAKGMLVVRFEPWKYEYAQHTDLFVALIREFAKQAKINETGKVWLDVAQAMLGIATSVFKQSLKKVTAGIIDIEDQRKEAELVSADPKEDMFQQIDAIQHLREKLAALIKAALSKQKKRRVCILIDDLDRCSPEHTVILLEAIKNFLLTDDVLFVFAIDRRVVSEMIESEYGLSSGYGDEYLTKIIQYSLTLPAPSHKDMLTDILEDHIIKMPDAAQGWIVEFADRFALEARKFKYLVYQLITQAKLAKINLDTDDPVDTESLFCAIYLKYRLPKVFNISKTAVRYNMGLWTQMAAADTNNKPEQAADYSRQLGISGTDKKILTDLYRHKLTNNNALMDVNRGKLEVMGFSRLIG